MGQLLLKSSAPPDRLLWRAWMLKDTARLHARLGRLLVDARASGRDAFRAIDTKVGWDQPERSISFAEGLTRSTDDGLEEEVERYPAVRRFDPTFLAAFTFRTKPAPSGARGSAITMGNGLAPTSPAECRTRCMNGAAQRHIRDMPRIYPAPVSRCLIC